jgi:hypothetical protein
MSQKQLDLFNNKVEETFIETIKEHENIFKALTHIENTESIDQIVIDLHNIARRVENNGNPDGIGYSIRAVADRLSECKKPGFHKEWVPNSESWYEP